MLMIVNLFLSLFHDSSFLMSSFWQNKKWVVLFFIPNFIFFRKKKFIKKALKLKKKKNKLLRVT